MLQGLLLPSSVSNSPLPLPPTLTLTLTSLSAAIKLLALPSSAALLVPTPLTPHPTGTGGGAGAGVEQLMHSPKQNISKQEKEKEKEKDDRILLCGYSGLMLPVMEDLVLAARAGGVTGPLSLYKPDNAHSSGAGAGVGGGKGSTAYSLRDLLFFSAVCGVGLDTGKWVGAWTVVRDGPSCVGGRV